MGLADRILEIGDGIRFVILLDGDGKVTEKQTRRDIKLILREELLERAIAQMTIVWAIANELGKQTGQPSRIVLHHELVDLVVVKAANLYCGMTVDKSVKSDDLSKKVKEFIEQQE